MNENTENFCKELGSIMTQIYILNIYSQIKCLKLEFIAGN